MHFTECFLEHPHRTLLLVCTMFTAHSSKIGISGYKVNLSMIVDLNKKILSAVYYNSVPVYNRKVKKFGGASINWWE